MTRILLVEDDPTLADGLTFALEQEGYEVNACAGVQEAVSVLDPLPDLAVLDVMLPDGSGFDLCRLIRMRSDLPVLFLTARDEEHQVVKGLDLGADDYVTKPFRLQELMSRIRSVLRRTDGKDTVRQWMDVRILPEKAQVLKGPGQEEVLLTPLEYRLLLTLVRHQGETVPREHIVRELWDAAGVYVTDNTLSVYIRRLREKLGDDARQPRYILTDRGRGYRAGTRP